MKLRHVCMWNSIILFFFFFEVLNQSSSISFNEAIYEIQGNVSCFAKN